MGKKLDLKNMIFGRWTVIEETNQRNIAGSVKWICKCECGNISLVSATSLKNGKTISCGCVQIESAKNGKTHGATIDGSVSLEYTSWCAMKSRCKNPLNPSYKDYGGRGITVCERWLNSFENFIEDMGNRPSSNHSLDRFPNVNGNYEPGNCRWANESQQQRGKRNNRWFEYNGEKMVLTDWANKLKVPFSSIHYHIKSGKSFDEVMEFYKTKQ